MNHTSPAETVEILTGMRKRINRGWTQNMLHNPRFLRHDQYCIVGAYQEETGQRIYETSATECIPALAAILNVISTAECRRSITEFNDSHSTRKHDVLAVIDEAIERVGVRMGDIGEPLKVIEFEPVPTSVPTPEPSPAPAPAKEPVPA